jgi:prepilin-type N-terminal cleavage/methylation domain-containing protein
MFRLSKKGFTLIELLVVISIIAILIAFGAASYSNAQKKARDARRIRDMQEIQNAMEQAYGTNGAYPDIHLDTQPGHCTNAGMTSYLNPFPSDPKTGNAPYYCSQAGNDVDYCICADLENTTGSGGNSSAQDCSATFGNSGTYYCVKNKQ